MELLLRLGMDVGAVAAVVGDDRSVDFLLQLLDSPTFDCGARLDGELGQVKEYIAHIKGVLYLVAHGSGGKDRRGKRRDTKRGVDAKALLHPLRQVRVEHAQD